MRCGVDDELGRERMSRVGVAGHFAEDKSGDGTSSIGRSIAYSSGTHELGVSEANEGRLIFFLGFELAALVSWFAMVQIGR